MRSTNFKLLLVAALAALTTGLMLSTAIGAQNGHRAKPKRALTTKLTGSEIPAPHTGDPDGRGRAKVRVLPRSRAVCFVLRWRNIATPTGAHIHRGGRGEVGPHAVDLFPPGPVRHRGCVDGVDRSLLRELARHPERFYVNVHNADFHDGAIRGQLGHAGGRLRNR